MNNRSRILLAASLASALALPVAIAHAGETKADDAKVHCYGVNKCKGVGDCGGQGHDCSGKNACKGQGFVEMDKDTCLKLEGGRLTESGK